MGHDHGPMRPFGALMPVAEAAARLLTAVRPVEEAEEVPIADAAGRVAAAELLAEDPVPRFARAVMDGYAVRAAGGLPADWPWRLVLAGAVHAGETPPPVRAGECVQIATGAPLPPGADTVVPVEETHRDGGTVLVLRAIPAGANVSPAGADFQEGDLVVGQGDALTPARVGAAAAAGAAALRVYRRPRVAIWGSGDEVRPPGASLGPGQVHDANGPALAALVRAHGGTPLAGGTLPDREDAVEAALGGGSGADLTVVTGGTSVGERDLVGRVLGRLAEVLFHGLAVKPGRPTLGARVRGQLVLGLPGNPTSCLQMAYVFLVPALRRMARLPDWAPTRVRAVLSDSVKSPPDKHHYFSVRLAAESGAQPRLPRAVPAWKESGTISSLSLADGWIEIPVGVATLAAGAEVEVVLFG